MLRVAFGCDVLSNSGAGTRGLTRDSTFSRKSGKSKKQAPANWVMSALFYSTRDSFQQRVLAVVECTAFQPTPHMKQYGTISCLKCSSKLSSSKMNKNKQTGHTCVWSIWRIEGYCCLDIRSSRFFMGCQQIVYSTLLRCDHFATRSCRITSMHTGHRTRSLMLKYKRQLLHPPPLSLIILGTHAILVYFLPA